MSFPKALARLECFAYHPDRGLLAERALLLPSGSELLPALLGLQGADWVRSEREPEWGSQGGIRVGKC